MLSGCVELVVYCNNAGYPLPSTIVAVSGATRTTSSGTSKTGVHTTGTPRPTESKGSDSKGSDNSSRGNRAQGPLMIALSLLSAGCSMILLYNP